MRALFLVLLLPLSCARQSAERPTETKAPDAIGGGPPIIVLPTADARTVMAQARCASAAACDDVEFDACVTREEATLPDLPCVTLMRARLNECVEAIHARTCTDTAAPPECAVEQLCSKEAPQ